MMRYSLLASFSTLSLSSCIQASPTPLLTPLGTNTPGNQTAATIHAREILESLAESAFHDNNGIYAAQVAVPMWLFAKDGDWASLKESFLSTVTDGSIVTMLSRICGGAHPRRSTKELRDGWRTWACRFEPWPRLYKPWSL